VPFCRRRRGLLSQGAAEEDAKFRYIGSSGQFFLNLFDTKLNG
jgi:hypothetical protein